jgi:SRSO17 transposase
LSSASRRKNGGLARLRPSRRPLLGPGFGEHRTRLHFVGEEKWSDERVLAKVHELVVPAIKRHGPIKAWIVDNPATAPPDRARQFFDINRKADRNGYRTTQFRLGCL